MAMASKHKAITGPLFRALSAQTPSLSGFVSSWKGSLAGITCNLESLIGPRCLIHTSSFKKDENSGTAGHNATENSGHMAAERSRTSGHMDIIRGALEEDSRRYQGSHIAQQIPEEKLDVVHIKLIKNNTFITVTDANGNRKIGASSGCLEEMKGGPKLSRYAAEATAEHIGRLSRNLGLKSVVMRVNGFTHFKKKKQAILSWKEGYTFGRGDRNPIAYIEDTTRRPHNGCRLPKKRRV